MVENSELRKAGLKVTLPRVKILQMLDSAEQRHMSAEDVYKALMQAGEDVGLATVYRVLTQFESAGLVIRHNFDGGHAVFELADAVFRQHHYAAQCTHFLSLRLCVGCRCYWFSACFYGVDLIKAA